MLLGPRFELPPLPPPGPAMPPSTVPFRPFLPSPPERSIVPAICETPVTRRRTGFTPMNLSVAPVLTVSDWMFSWKGFRES